METRSSCAVGGVPNHHLSLPRKTGCGIGGRYLGHCLLTNHSVLSVLSCWRVWLPSVAHQAQAPEERRSYCAIATVTISSPSVTARVPCMWLNCTGKEVEVQLSPHRGWGEQKQEQQLCQPLLHSRVTGHPCACGDLETGWVRKTTS